MKNTLKRFNYILIAILLIISRTPFVAGGMSDESLNQDSNKGYVYVADSGKIKMYADMQTGLFKIVNTDTGTEYTSSPKNLDDDVKTIRKNRMAYGSQIIVDYAVLENFSYVGLINQVNSQVNCVNKGTVHVKKIKNGIRVEYDFKTLSMFIPVEYTLNGCKLVARIVISDIKEGKDAAILNIHLLPSFGAADWNTEGYLFVPDGTGAIINFNSNKENNEYEARVYGEELSLKKELQTRETETIRMPVFGICKTGNSAVLGNITVGDGSASVKGIAGNEHCGYNMCYGIMNYRTVSESPFKGNNGEITIYRLPQQKYDLNCFEVQYSLLDGEQSDYMALAESYRQYLIEEKGLGKSDSAQIMNLDVYGALETAANFMGFKYTKLKALTCYVNIITILESMKHKGIDDVSFRYIGWQNDGISNKHIVRKSDLIKCLGGRTGWEKLQTYIEKNKIEAVYDVDLLQYRKSFFNNAASTAFNTNAYQYQYMRSVYATKLDTPPCLLLKPVLITGIAEKYLNDIDGKIDHLSLSTISNVIYSDFKKKSGTYRSSFTGRIENVIKMYSSQGVSVSGEGANAYALPYLKTVYSAPSSCSGYRLFDKEIPFYQLVLKGYISMTTGAFQAEDKKNDEFLKAVETGSALLFNCTYNDAVLVRETAQNDLYSSTYTLWQDEAVKQYKQYVSLYKSVLGKSIVAHREIMPNVMETFFENGVSVIVNYTYENVRILDKTVDARGFTVSEGGTK